MARERTVMVCKAPAAEGLLMASERDVPISARVPPDLAKRLDKLKAKLERDPTVRTLGKVNRSMVVKLALLRGVEALEAQYGGK
jgi:hypothetical protein